MPVSQTSDGVIDVHGSGKRAHLGSCVCTLAAATLVIACSTADPEPQLSSSAESAESFDAPIGMEIVDLGGSPRAALSCYYFPDFMVKEYYLGGKGAEWLSILRNPGKAPECTGSHERGERVIEYSEWEGYFRGVKGSLVFFDASDAFNGHFPFAIYDSSTGKKVFEDSAYNEGASSSSRVGVVSTQAGYVLKYLRAAGAGCDLHSEGSACWSRVKAQFSLQSDEMPLCTGYEHVSDLLGTDQVESQVAYPVEVTLSPEPAIRSVAGPVKCWPAQ